MRRRPKSVTAYRMYFSSRVKEHGSTIQALDYGSPSSQVLKFRVLADGIRNTSRQLSFLDVGCGFGDFFGYLKSHGVRVGRYSGVDLVPEMVRIARQRYPEGDFKVRDILRTGLPGKFDYGVANGIFYLRAADSREYIKRMVKSLWRYCKVGLLFNARSTHADPEFVARERHLYHYDPNYVLGFCLDLTRAVVFRHDYMPHEFTIYMYRDTSP